MRRRIDKYRRIQPAPHEDYQIGCILLSQPFFFDESEWIEVPRDWSREHRPGQGLRHALGRGGAALGGGAAAARGGGVRGARRGGGAGALRRAVPGAPAPGPGLLPDAGDGHVRAPLRGHRREGAAGARRGAHPGGQRGRPAPAGQRPAAALGRPPAVRRGLRDGDPGAPLPGEPQLKEEFDNGEPYFPFDGQELWLPPEPGSGRTGSSSSGTGTWCSGGKEDRSELNRPTLAGDFVPASATPTEARPARRALRPRASAPATASHLDPVDRGGFGDGVRRLAVDEDPRGRLAARA